jgi:fucose permease
MIKNLTDFLRNPAARAVGIIFAFSGLGFGTWASFIPYVKDKFNLDEAQLGLLLFSMPVGTFIVNPLTVFFIKRWGAVRVSLVGIALSTLFFTLPVIMPWLPFVSIGLFLSGGMFGFTNVTMNTCASLLEEKSNIRIMSTCHGMWSVGAMSGALFSGIALLPLKSLVSDWITPQTVYEIILLAFVLVIIWMIRNDLDSIINSHQQSTENVKLNWRTFRPGRSLWILIIICLCTYLAEGSMADWSAVYLKEITHAPETIAGWGFAIYAFFMALGRFMGDQLIFRFGAMQVLRTGGGFVLTGLIVVIISTSPWWTLPGFMLIGMGISLASPILYGSAAKIKGLPPGVGLAILNTFAMASFLAGPVLIGFIAKIADLRIAFMFVAAASVIWIIQTTRVIRNV